MKLQNEETGQVENFCIDKDQICSCDRAFVYDSLTQLQDAGWKDYEEPPLFWYIDDYDTMCGSVGEKQNLECNTYTEQQVEKFKAIGNYFETEEEAEKAVEKLKAWKRLSKNRYLFGRFIDLIYSLNANSREFDEYMDDILLLFGGEE